MVNALVALADRFLIERWRRLLALWSIRVALFWGAMSGLILVWPAFYYALPLWVYALGGIAISVIFAAARMLKQPGML